MQPSRFRRGMRGFGALDAVASNIHTQGWNPGVASCVWAADADGPFRSLITCFARVAIRESVVYDFLVLDAYSCLAWHPPMH